MSVAMRRALIVLALVACETTDSFETPTEGNADGGAPHVPRGAEADAAVDVSIRSAQDDASTHEGGLDASIGEPEREHFDVWMHPDGDDARDGLSKGAAVATLERVHEILMIREPDKEVHVRVLPGTYHAQKVLWTFTMPQHRIVFMPADGGKDRPVFDGCLANGACPGGTWLRLKHAAGQKTNLHFEYMHIKNYQTAISLDGGRNQEATSNAANRIYGCYLENIGNVFNAELEPSTAALRLVNSDDNQIANNHFVNVVNTRSGGLIHAIYVAHMSDRNVISRNRFSMSTGDPVRVRDFSNGNQITGNRFSKVGTAAGYTDWYCDHEVRDDCTKATAECPSWNNAFRDNTLDGDWECKSLGTFFYFQDDSTAGCEKPDADARRLRTSGNETTTVPCSMQ